jgi:hypothetical protein
VRQPNANEGQAAIRRLTHEGSATATFAARPVLRDTAGVEFLTVLSRFRTDFYHCQTARADALFELTGALLCTDGAVRSLVDLTLTPEHRPGHGALCDGLDRGRLDVASLRWALSALPLPRAAGRRIVLAKPATWPAPGVTTTSQTTRYATATAWDRLHLRLTHRAAWLDHDSPLPIIEGTLIRLAQFVSFTVLESADPDRGRRARRGRNQPCSSSP